MNLKTLIEELAGTWEVVAEAQDAAKPGRRETLRECADLLRMLVSTASWNEREKELEELVRSACAIAERKGAGTAWDRFAASVRAVGLNGVTARTYRILPSDAESAALAGVIAPVPEGWKLVPVKLTEEMYKAAHYAKAYLSFEDFALDYADMLAATPASFPVVPVGQDNSELASSIANALLNHGCLKKFYEAEKVIKAVLAMSTAPASEPVKAKCDCQQGQACRECDPDIPATVNAQADTTPQAASVDTASLWRLIAQWRDCCESGYGVKNSVAAVDAHITALAEAAEKRGYEKGRGDRCDLEKRLDAYLEAHFDAQAGSELAGLDSLTVYEFSAHEDGKCQRYVLLDDVRGIVQKSGGES